jgi:ParB-like chromosome segregation protein Spo0J
MEHHEFADVFPMLSDKKAEELADSIKRNGLRDPITTYRGKILDGRNRYKACLAVGVTPDFTPFVGGEQSALEFVIDKNMHRRDLTVSQRATAAAKMVNMKQGFRTDLVSDETMFSLQSASDKLDVSRATTARAAKVLKEGTPELVEALEKGEITVAAAERIVKQSTEPDAPEKPKPITIRVNPEDLQKLANDLVNVLSYEELQTLRHHLQEIIDR